MMMMSLKLDLCLLSRYFCFLDKIFDNKRKICHRKKKEEAKPKPLIGRVGTNLKMGIVGLPNAGLVSEKSFQKYLICYFVFGH